MASLGTNQPDIPATLLQAGFVAKGFVDGKGHIPKALYKQGIGADLSVI